MKGYRKGSTKDTYEWYRLSNQTQRDIVYTTFLKIRLAKWNYMLRALQNQKLVIIQINL